MAAIVLTSRTVTDHTVMYGTMETALPAAKRFTIESSPAGEEFFNQVVPTGKQWVVRVDLSIVETDV